MDHFDLRNKNFMIGIVGLGYVGLPLAVEFGKQYNVIGYDLNNSRIKELSGFKDKTGECTPDDIRLAKFLKFSKNIDDLNDANVYIITVPTPIDNAKRPDLSFLVNACRLIGPKLNKEDLVVFESTVYPGVTENVCVPILEETSNLEFNVDFSCGYSPERVNPGDKLNTLTKITKIVSASNKKATTLMEELYSSIIDAGIYSTQSIKVAEAAKVIENCQRDLNIAFVNELSVIFNKLEIDTLEVLEAAASKWNFVHFKPGMVGGHCIGVDPYYLTHIAEVNGYNPQVILGGRRINDNMARYAARSTIMKMLQNNIDVARSRVGIMGVTFKENCPDIRNSKVFDLIQEFKKWNVTTINCDNWANDEEVDVAYGVKLSKLEDLREMDCLVVAVGHDEYRNLPMEIIRGFCKMAPSRVVLADLKGIYDKSDARTAGFDVFRL